jgi:hypothetical protein
MPLEILPGDLQAGGAALSCCLGEPAIFIALIWWGGRAFFD